MSYAWCRNNLCRRGIAGIRYRNSSGLCDCMWLFWVLRRGRVRYFPETAVRNLKRRRIVDILLKFVLLCTVYLHMIRRLTLRSLQIYKDMNKASEEKSTKKIIFPPTRWNIYQNTILVNNGSYPEYIKGDAIPSRAKRATPASVIDKNPVLNPYPTSRSGNCGELSQLIAKTQLSLGTYYQIHSVWREVDLLRGIVFRGGQH